MRPPYLLARLLPFPPFLGLLILLLAAPTGGRAAPAPERFEIQLAQPVSNNSPRAGAGFLESPGATDEYRFTASAGQSVYFDALSGDPCDPRFRWKCVGPTGQVLFDRAFAPVPGCGNGDPGPLTLEAPGDYLVTVSGIAQATGAYSFNVVPVLAQSFTLIPGQPVARDVPAPGAGLIETPGATDTYSFTATSGQTFYFDALSGDPCDPKLRWQCVSPTGQVLFDRGFAAVPSCGNGDPGSLTLEVSGAYTVIVRGITEGTGAYSFNVVPVRAQSFALTLGQTVTRDVPGSGAGLIETPGSTDAYTFTATTGQSVYFDALSGDPCDPKLRWRCVGPTGQVLFDRGFAAVPGCGNGDPGTFTLDVPGTYSVTIQGIAEGTGAYSFNVVPLNSQSFALTLGQTVARDVPAPGAGVIETPGATDTYTLTVTAGQKAYFDALSGDPCDPKLRWKCVGPTGRVLFDQAFAGTSGCGNGDPALHTFAESGTYSIILSGERDALGEYTFRVGPPPNGPDLVAGPLQVPVLAVPGTTVSLVWGVTNVGNADAIAPWTEQILLMAESPGGPARTLATLRGDISLPPGGSLQRTQSLVFASDGPAGALRLGVQVDADDALLELNEQNNLQVAVDPLEVPLALSLLLSERNVLEGSPAQRASVIRNGDRSTALQLELSSQPTGPLSLPSTLIIPAGAAHAAFEVRALADGVVVGPKSAEITVRAEGYIAAGSSIALEDADVPRLTLEVPATEVTEGATVRVIVRRELATADPLRVFFSATPPDRLELPSSITIPAGEPATSLEIRVRDDAELSGSSRVSLTAYATGHLDSPPQVLLTLDNDLPALTLALTKTEIGEGDGPQASVATVTRNPVGSFDLPLAVESSGPAWVQTPTSILLPAGQGSVQFPLGALEDAVTNAARVVTLTVYPLDPVTRQRLGPGTSTAVTVTDDDRPSLRLVLARRLVGEGLDRATTATVFRTGPLDAPVLVTLVSSDPGEARVPNTLTLPAGQANASFDIASVNDALPDANQIVTITASAPGLGTGSDLLVVSDVVRPDLVVHDLSAPADAETESSINVSYRILNQGLATVTTNVLTRVFLSRDPIPGDDTLLGQFDFAGSFPPQQEIQQTLQGRLPVAAGDYWLVVVTDADHRVEEMLEDNNTTLGIAPIRVREAYTATVAPDTSRSNVGTPVVLRGRARQPDSLVAAAQVPVHVHVVTRETRRVLLAFTDGEGRFVATFQPLPNEAGRYDVAAAHPGAVRPTSQAQFAIVGLLGRPPIQPVSLVEQVAHLVEIPLENLGEVPLTGLEARILSAPSNVTGSVSFGADTTLGAGGHGMLRLTLTAERLGEPGGEIRVRLNTAEGATSDLTVPVRVESRQPRFTVIPAELVAGMKRGGQAIVEFDLTNPGGTSTGPITVLAPDAPWLQVATSTPLAPLAAGATQRITLQLTPAQDLALGEHTGALVIQSGDLSIPVPFRFRALAEAKGGLRVTATDEYTYYAEGSPRVTNAVVLVRDATTRDVVAEGVTDAFGRFEAPSLFEGYYDLEVTADQHVTYRGVSLVRAGTTEEVQAFLSRETVRYYWTVEPTGIEDRTRLSIETVFESFVPVPVVTLEPNLIDLAEIESDVTQIDLRISNHGLIAANKLRLGFSNHPDWQLEPLISELGSLPARSSLVIPLTIRRLKPPALAPHQQGSALHAGGPCGISGGVVWTLICGTEQSYATPMQILNSGSDCGGGGGSWGGTGAAGAPFASAPYFPVRIDCNTNTPPCKPLDLPEVNLSPLLKPLATAFDGLANFYLERNLWTRTLGLSVETEPEVKGKLGLCCTNEVPVDEITANLSGKVSLKMGDTLKLAIKESLPEYALASNLKGVLELNGDLTFGASAEPSFKVSGSYQDGCGREKPDISVTITGGATFRGGVFGKAKASFKALDVPIKFDESVVNGGLTGTLEFSWTYNNHGESKFCYKSDGLYLEANAKLFGLSVDLFYPTNKFYIIHPQTICDPPEALLATMGLDQVVAEARRRVDAAAHEASTASARHLAPHGTSPRTAPRPTKGARGFAPKCDSSSTRT
ncbi:MAG: hypothetical protein IT580_08765 [Verrucomicrobiales bacterium]|nr:hypothetical protein [Verrucomicrobiales bacterium]